MNKMTVTGSRKDTCQRCFIALDLKLVPILNMLLYLHYSCYLHAEEANLTSSSFYILLSPQPLLLAFGATVTKHLHDRCCVILLLHQSAFNALYGQNQHLTEQYTSSMLYQIHASVAVISTENMTCS